MDIDTNAFIDLSETSYRELQDYLEHKNLVLSSDRDNNDVGTNPFQWYFSISR